MRFREEAPGRWLGLDKVIRVKLSWLCLALYEEWEYRCKCALLISCNVYLFSRLWAKAWEDRCTLLTAAQLLADSGSTTLFLSLRVMRCHRRTWFWTESASHSNTVKLERMRAGKRTRKEREEDGRRVCGLIMKWPSQTHVLKAWFLVGGDILGGFGNFRRSA
jgi:hypothetical protein